MSQEYKEQIERWTAKRRAALIVRVQTGETSVAKATRPHGLRGIQVEGWHDQFLRAGENGVRRRPQDEEALKDSGVLFIPTLTRRRL